MVHPACMLDAVDHGVLLTVVRRKAGLRIMADRAPALFGVSGDERGQVGLAAVDGGAVNIGHAYGVIRFARFDALYRWRQGVCWHTHGRQGFARAGKHIGVKEHNYVIIFQLFFNKGVAQSAGYKAGFDPLGKDGIIFRAKRTPQSKPDNPG